MKIEYQDRIDDYLLNRMSDEERKCFEMEAASDAELQEQLTFTKDVQYIMKSRNDKLAKLKEWEYKDQVAVAKPHPTYRRYLYWLSGIAALFMVVFLLHNLWIVEDELQNGCPKIRNMVIRGSSSYPDIRQLLERKEYEEALSSIQQKTLLIREDSVKFSHDISLKENEKEKKMLLLKEQQDELDWLKVYALLGLQRKEEAMMLLSDMRSNEGWYQMSADSLYQKLQ